MTIPTPLELMIPILDFSKDKEEKNIDQTNIPTKTFKK